MGYASAIAYVLFALIFILTIVQMKFVKGDIQY
jgi:ABC-type sugar transport system permease subunit